MQMGAFDSQGNCIRESLLFRSFGQVGFPGTFVRPDSTQDHSAIYAGPLIRHYGHFLLEGLSRLWFAKERPDIPIVWACPETSGRQHVTDYTSWQAELLEILNISNPAIFASVPLRFKELIIPDAGFVIYSDFHPTQEAFLGACKRMVRPGLKLWLSRSALGDKATNLMEPTIERRLAEAGWTIIHPEQLSISEQLAFLSAAERIAGDEGSAFHTLVLLEDARDLKVDIFYRRDPSNHKKPSYETIADTKGISQVLHTCTDEVVIGRKGPHIRKISYNASEYLNKLEVPLAMPTVVEGKESRLQGGHSARRLNRFARANNAQTYLEIGVARGNTFLNVNVGRKHAVDPRFRFDPRAFETEHTRFFEMPSDDFFLYGADGNTKYDIMFLDGLHTFEQTFRDFCASQRHCHEDTIWMIDDVYPSDVFSAHPDRSETIKLRRLHKLASRAWHGDVFKTIFAIHDFFPNFSYKTINSKGNPQAVLVRRPRSSFKPFYNSLEAISRMSYDDFLHNRDVLNLESEEDVLQWVGTVFRQRRKALRPARSTLMP